MTFGEKSARFSRGPHFSRPLCPLREVGLRPLLGQWCLPLAALSSTPVHPQQL